MINIIGPFAYLKPVLYIHSERTTYTVKIKQRKEILSK